MQRIETPDWTCNIRFRKSPYVGPLGMLDMDSPVMPLCNAHTAEQFLTRFASIENANLFFPLERVTALLLYGRQGAGKTTAINAPWRRSDGTYHGMRFLEDANFQEIEKQQEEDDDEEGEDYRGPLWVARWTMQPWNVDDFCKWVDDAIAVMQDIHITDALEMCTVVIRRINVLNTVRHQAPLLQLMRLIGFMKGAGSATVKIILTSDASPGTLDPDLVRMIDKSCFVGPFGVEDRRRFIREHLRRYQERVDDLKNASDDDEDDAAAAFPRDAELFAVDLAEGAEQADPDHVVNLLAEYAANCTPGEMAAFLRRVASTHVRAVLSDPTSDDACLSPDLVLAHVHRTDGTPRLTPYDPAREWKDMFTYSGTQREAEARERRTMAVVGDGAVVEREPAEPPAAPSPVQAAPRYDTDDIVMPGLQARVNKQLSMLTSVVPRKRGRRAADDDDGGYQPEKATMDPKRARGDDDDAKK